PRRAAARTAAFKCDATSAVKDDRGASRMPAPTLIRRLFMLAEALAFAGAVAVAAITWSAEDWTPVTLVALLLGLALIGQRLTVEIRGQRLTAAFVAWVLA